MIDRNRFRDDRRCAIGGIGLFPFSSAGGQPDIDCRALLAGARGHAVPDRGSARPDGRESAPVAPPAAGEER